MAVTERKRTVVNPGGRRSSRKLSAKHIKAGFGGKRRKSAASHHRKAARKNRSGPRPKAAAVHHRRRSTAKKATRKNYGKIFGFTLPKELQVATSTKKNKGRRAKAKASSHHRRARRARTNPGHRRRTRRNPGVGQLTGLVTSAVFTIAGAVGTKYITQMVLGSSNTGIMGYFGNIVSAFVLSYAVHAFMHNPHAAAGVLAGGFVQVVLRLIADYTPFGQYTANLGVGDYLTQINYTPQRLLSSNPHNAMLTLDPTMGGAAMGQGGMGGGLYGSGNNLYNAA